MPGRLPRAFLGACLTAFAAHGLPQLRVAPYINMGQPIVVHYNVTNGQDGRGQHSASDWIGLYRKGDCEAKGKKGFNTGSLGPQGFGSESPRQAPVGMENGGDWEARVAVSAQADDWNLHERHKCFLHWHYIPYGEPQGRVIFDYEWYRHAGEYDVRYFYGDDPTVPGAYHWVGEGYVCHSWQHATLQAPSAADEPIGASSPQRLELHSTSGDGIPVIDSPVYGEQASTGTVSSWMSPTGTEVPHMGMYRGVEGMAKVDALSLDDCQCNPATVTSKLSIKHATLGANCHHTATNPDGTAALASAALGIGSGADMTQVLGGACDGKHNCSYALNTSQHGDPAEWCHKELQVDYMCSGHYLPEPYETVNGPERLTYSRVLLADAVLPFTALGKTLTLACPQHAARDECLAKRAGCGRCVLDTVQRATVQVVGRAEGETDMRSEYTAWQDTEGLPGFEMSVN